MSGRGRELLSAKVWSWGAAGHIPRRGDSRGQAKAAAAGFEGGHFGVCSRDQLPEVGSLHLPGIPVAQAIMG